MLVYGIGLGHFARENESALAALVAELTAVGADPAALRETLSSGRRGVEAPAAFVMQLEVVEPPLPPLEWSAALAGIVVAAVAIVLIVRLVRREDTWGTVTIDETIFVALAVTVAATLFGGPLLAGAALMPFLFTVIVHRTRLGPGWKPSYLYVVPVLAPAVALGAGLVGYASLPGDILAFVVLPFAGAFGLPLRATIRKHFDR
ncbi:molecular chaperone DnaJ [Halopiger thermotolerans]